jgi:hypothetical protein
MRQILATCLFLAIALPCRAQGDKPKPNTLTPKEIADGWILLFDGETTFRWEAEGNLRVVDGALILDGEKATVFHSTRWGSFELRFEYRLVEPPMNKGNTYLNIDGRAGHPLQAVNNAWFKTRHFYDFDAATGQYISHVETVFIDKVNWGGGRVAQKRRPETAPFPRIGFQTLKGAVLEVRDLKLRPRSRIHFKGDDLNKVETVAPESIFNGKDLTGWKEFPGKKSKFAVVDGAINVKDGPGDLQTVGKYKDFVLQADCISNGKHLNSGIFFRCRDNEYQNGYEAQIHNGFAEKPKKYLIEEYDPKTNKLTGKKEMMFNAIDYGTGAIYRRMPARKQMAKDGEWFTMTIVAHGNHLATWVNGVQVTDWTDNRPKSDNARTGCKLEAGHLSIQGHDPTTNLSFKNLRIAELK